MLLAAVLIIKILEVVTQGPASSIPEHWQTYNDGNATVQTYKAAAGHGLSGQSLRANKMLLNGDASLDNTSAPGLELVLSGHGELQQAQHAKQAQQLQTSDRQRDANTLEVAVADALTDRQTPPTILQQTSTSINGFDSSTLVNPSDSSTLVNPSEASASFDGQLSNTKANDLDISTSDHVSTKETDDSSATVTTFTQNAASERQAVNELIDEVVGAQKQDAATLSESETKSPKSGFWNQPQIQRADLDSSSQGSYSSRKSGQQQVAQDGLPVDWDWQTYLALNPDVDIGEGHSEAAAILHWRVWGQAEKRPYKASMLTSN